jgi:fatty acid desaturase
MMEVRSGTDSQATSVEILRRLRKFLLMLAVLLLAGALVELWLVGHTEDWVQLIPFVLAIVGIIVGFLVLFQPGKRTIQIMRIWMAVVVMGTLFGVYQHITGNIAFEREVDPKATTSQLAWQGLGGGNPLLAPGVLAIAAVLALAATYRHDVT